MRTQEQAANAPIRGDLWKQNSTVPDEESDFILVSEDAGPNGRFSAEWWVLNNTGRRWVLVGRPQSSNFWLSANLYIGNVLTDDISGPAVDAARTHLGASAPAAPVQPPKPEVAPRKIVDVVSDEARETRAKVEDEIAEVKAALADMAAIKGIRENLAQIQTSQRNAFGQVTGTLSTVDTRTASMAAAQAGLYARVADLAMAHTRLERIVLGGFILNAVLLLWGAS